jgi:hypothetical protein
VVDLVELVGDAYVGGDVVACVLKVRLVRQVRYVLGEQVLKVSIRVRGSLQRGAACRGDSARIRLLP